MHHSNARHRCHYLFTCVYCVRRYALLIFFRRLLQTPSQIFSPVLFYYLFGIFERCPWMRVRANVIVIYSASCYSIATITV